MMIAIEVNVSIAVYEQKKWYTLSLCFCIRLLINRIILFIQYLLQLLPIGMVGSHCTIAL